MDDLTDSLFTSLFKRAGPALMTCQDGSLYQPSTAISLEHFFVLISNAADRKKAKLLIHGGLAKRVPLFCKSVTPAEIRCNTRNGIFSVAHGGKHDIQRHLTSDKHKKALTTASTSSSLSTYFRQEKYSDKEAELTRAEGVWAFHRNVIAPYSSDNLKTELNDVPFICIVTDASNNKDITIFPTLVQYFHPTTGINIKILYLLNVPGETTVIIYDSLVGILEKHNLKEKVIGFCADNANINFGGVQHEGQCNVFFKLQENLGRNCAAISAHNTIHTAADLLPRWEETKSSTEQRWLEVFGKLNELEIPYIKLPGHCPVPSLFARDKHTY
ncbi:hypothetical protein PR048_017184 [Dryococelus australis]|uniref:MULE transposase domain-containing protein n=1 Tax=Dryococelus australis TaxID=614101 RepID=A0ABQ9H8T9_9NEOP|nr:hypothetical protein PR048_017184 [Dryococelus australis]